MTFRPDLQGPALAKVYGFDGQSNMQHPDAANDIPAKIQAATAGQSIVYLDAAVGGTAWVQGTNNRQASASYRLDRYVNSGRGEKVLFETAGTFEINLGNTAAQTLGYAEDYWSDRYAAGWDRIITTTIPNSTGFDPTEEAERLLTNAALLGTTLPYVTVIDLSALDAAFDDASTGAPNWNADGVHILEPLAEIIANAMLGYV